MEQGQDKDALEQLLETYKDLLVKVRDFSGNLLSGNLEQQLTSYPNNIKEGLETLGIAGLDITHALEIQTEMDNRIKRAAHGGSTYALYANFSGLAEYFSKNVYGNLFTEVKTRYGTTVVEHWKEIFLRVADIVGIYATQKDEQGNSLEHLARQPNKLFTKAEELAVADLLKKSGLPRKMVGNIAKIIDVHLMKVAAVNTSGVEKRIEALGQQLKSEGGLLEKVLAAYTVDANEPNAVSLSQQDTHIDIHVQRALNELRSGNKTTVELWRLLSLRYRFLEQSPVSLTPANTAEFSGLPEDVGEAHKEKVENSINGYLYLAQELPSFIKQLNVLSSFLEAEDTTTEEFKLYLQVLDTKLVERVLLSNTSVHELCSVTAQFIVLFEKYELLRYLPEENLKENPKLRKYLEVVQKPLKLRNVLYYMVLGKFSETERTSLNLAKDFLYNNPETSLPKTISALVEAWDMLNS